MNVFQFNKRRTKSLASWLAILLTPGVLMLVPVVQIFTLPIWILWLTIPATLFTVLGIRSYEFQEFGAMPKGATDVAFIVGFWVIAAFFLSWFTNRKSRSPSWTTNRKSRSAPDFIERTVSGIGFSVLCFLIWGGLTGLCVERLLASFSWMDVVWLVYNATIAVLFLVRSRPTAVSLNPRHWLVALLASFSGLFFAKGSTGIGGTEAVAHGLILFGLAGSGTAALALRRSYDFLPALRGVTTDWLFRFIRHPMYVSSILIRLGYLAMHPSMYNAVVFAVMVRLYMKRVDYEENIMQQDERYIEYMQQVRYRFLPGIY